MGELIHFDLDVLRRQKAEKDLYFPVKCPQCGWIGISDEAAGGGAIADTGDYEDIFCPTCFKDGEGIGIVLDEIEWLEWEKREHNESLTATNSRKEV